MKTLGTQKLIALIGLALSPILLAACSGGGSISGGGGAGGSGGATLATTAVFPTASGSGWTPIVNAGRYFIEGLAISINGTCSLGIASVKVSDGTNTSTVACSNSGTFAYSHTYGVDPGGNLTFTLTALSSGGTPISGGTLTVLAWVSTSVPTTPVVTAPAGSSNNGAAFQAPLSPDTLTISGTCSNDTDHLILDGVTKVPAVIGGGCTWTTTVNLFNGLTGYHFVAVNTAGGQSPAYIQNVQWSSPTYLGGAFSGGPIVSHDTIHHGEFTMQYQQGTSNPNLLTGFNYILNSERANP